MRIGNANYYKHFTLGKKNSSESFLCLFDKKGNVLNGLIICVSYNNHYDIYQSINGLLTMECCVLFLFYM